MANSLRHRRSRTKKERLMTAIKSNKTEIEVGRSYTNFTMEQVKKCVEHNPHDLYSSKISKKGDNEE